MNRPFTRWFVLIILLVIVIVAISIPALTDGSQYQTLSVPASGMTLATPGASSGATMTPGSFAASTSLPVDPGGGKPIMRPTAANNCTYSPAYWVTHADTWPTQFVIGSYRYTKAEALNYLQASQADISTLLFLYLNTAYLNIVNGADPSSIEATALDASDWLNEHPPGSSPLGVEAQPAVQLTIRLFEFNLGNTGPGRCQDDTVKMTQTLGSQVPVLMMTPSLILLTSIAPQITEPTPTATATALATATGAVVQSTDYVPPPTATHKPGRGGASPTQTAHPTPRPTEVLPTAPPTREPLPTPPPP